MLTELLMQDERRAGREEGRIEGRTEDRKEFILEALSELGSVPDFVKEKIMQEKNLDTLKGWMKLAAKTNSVEAFMDRM